MHSLSRWLLGVWILGASLLAGDCRPAEAFRLTWSSDEIVLRMRGTNGGSAVLYESPDLESWSPIYAFPQLDSEETIPIRATNACAFFRLTRTNCAVPEQFVWIRPGRFLMGSPTNEAMRSPDEGPVRAVTICRGFWMSRYEVTVRDFELVMGTNPSAAPSHSLRPVENVTWKQAMEYCRRQTLSGRETGTIPPGTRFRLPSEAEWEYACRAGTSTRFSFGDDLDDVMSASFAWRAANSMGGTHPVGEKLPNPWGLYDIHGNVFEWCLDFYGPYPGAAGIEPTGINLFRGGSWVCPPHALRSASRHPGGLTRASYIGFRMVLGPEPDTVLR